MPKFMLVYKGAATDMSEMTSEESQAVMAKWGEWMGKVGPAMLDMGTPFGASMSKVDDGTTGPAMEVSGYSIIEADDLAAASGLADGHPYLSDGNGDYAIDILEMMPVPEM